MAKLDDLKKQKQEMLKAAEAAQLFGKAVKEGQTRAEVVAKIFEDIEKVEQSITDELKRQTEFRKGSVKIDKELSKVSSDILKSNEGILGTILKGNIAGLLQKNAVKATLSLQEKHLSARQALNKKIETGNIKDTKQKIAVQKIGQDIEDGLVDQQEVKDRIRAIDGLSVSDQIKFGALLDKQFVARDKMLETEKESEAAQERINRANAKLVGVFGLLAAAANAFAGTLDKIGETFGSLTVLGDDVKNSLVDSSVEATKLGGGIDDVASITNTLASNFGMNVDEAAKLSSKVFDTSKAIGLSADEGANLFGVLTQTANLSADQAEKLAEGAFQLARQAGVAPSAVMKDIAGSAEVIASFTKDGGNNIADAAVQARQLGMTLQDTAKVAEGLLNFEDSITKEVEASVLIGRQLNLQKARELALNNDIAGAMKEVVNQVGSEEEFNSLNLIQRKALADSIGVSVQQLSQMVGESDKLNKSGAMAGKSFRDLLGEEGISNLTQLTNSIKAVGASLTNALGPALMSVVGAFKPLVEFVGSVLNKLNELGVIVPIVGAGFAFLAAKSIALSVASFAAAYSQAAKSGALLPFPFNIAAIAAGVGAVGAAVMQSKSVNDFKSGPGGITHMSGPAGSFELNPRDSVLATTNPIRVNDVISAPAGGVQVNTGGEQRVKFEITQDTISGVLATNQDAFGSPSFDNLTRKMSLVS